MVCGVRMYHESTEVLYILHIVLQTCPLCIVLKVWIILGGTSRQALVLEEALSVLRTVQGKVCNVLRV